MAGNSSIKKLTRKVCRDRWLQKKDVPPVSILPIEKWPQKWQDRIKAAKMVACYMPIREELRIRDLVGALQKTGVKFCFPRVEGDVIAFYEVSEECALNQGKYGILEPGEMCNRVDPESIDIMLIPATAYGRDGTRLGRGKGYYDKYVGNNRHGHSGAFTGHTIGVIPMENLMGTVPSDTWDLKVSGICTESAFIDVEG